MNVALRRGMTTEEFLDWEERQPERWEFDGSRPVAMVGGTSAHGSICLGIGAELRERLRGGPCRVYVAGMKTRPGASIRYPDAIVTCSPVENQATIVDHPVVVFEVLSPSTSSIDQIDKNAEYRAMPSVQRYVMLSQTVIGAAVFERRGPDWVGSLLTAPGAVLDMPELGISVPLAAFYEGVIDPS